MKKIIYTLTLVTVLASCGTMQGVFNGAGEVLTGMGKDAKSLGGLLN